MTTSVRQSAAPVVVNPKRAEHERVTQQLVNQYHEVLKSITTDWKSMKDRYGNTIAIVPCWRIEFKDGSDFEMELEEATRKSGGRQYAH